MVSVYVEEVRVFVAESFYIVPFGPLMIVHSCVFFSKNHLLYAAFPLYLSGHLRRDISVPQ